MYSNLSKSQTLPTMAIRVSFESQCSKQFSTFTSNSHVFTSGFCLKPYLNPSFTTFGTVKSLKHDGNLVGFTILGKKRTCLVGVNDTILGNVGRFSSSLSGDGVNGRRGALPWLNESDPGRVMGSGSGKGKVSRMKDGRSSWEVSAEKFMEKKRGLNEESEMSRNRMFDSRQKRGLSNVDAEESVGKSGLGKVSSVKGGRSSWEVSAEKFIERRSRGEYESEMSRNGRFGSRENRRSSNVDVEEEERGREDNPRWDRDMIRSRNRTFDSRERRHSPNVDVVEDVEEDERGEDDEVDDPRWDRIRSRFRGEGNGKEGFRRGVPQKWSRQENWGRKTWREANESSVPKMVGEGVYGVGPVLAALSAGRREFYVLYVQEGLDLSKNNKRKKDKKGFEKVLKMADKIGLSVKEVSKHDLNMVVDNRPHQGLVLDASPLEMVSVRELDPVSEDHDTGLLWVALDEVTDPQNLGAIIRSSYFFGACGVVLCAKNSAPLSGVVSKASAGSLELMEMRSCKNMMQFLTSSAENGWRVIGGSVSSRATPLHEVPSGKPTILVMGSEGTGLRPLVERSCTHLVRIPGNIPVDESIEPLDDEENAETEHQCSEDVRSFMAVESLNVSVAAGVLLHHLTGSKNSGDSNPNSLGQGSELE